VTARLDGCGAELPAFREEDFDGEAAQLLLAEFFAEIAELYPGWLPSRGPSADAADFQRPHGCFLVGYDGERPVACGGLKRLHPRVGELKRLYVRPEARRRGLGRALLEHLELVAGRAGYEALRLDTGPQQPAALRLFAAAGYRPIPDYNGNPYARHWFEKQLWENPRRTRGSARS